ncbi:unnamed protein product [Blepharisma stoltei]|uniref:Uncharacterized protein n=1 Tax=Blepharisma stoltei TaxID=1481888 RepID=A0AAU9J3X3_9CILI|nr:unnamed protein product [Blepharisma stoltei]
MKSIAGIFESSLDNFEREKPICNTPLKVEMKPSPIRINKIDLLKVDKNCLNSKRSLRAVTERIPTMTQRSKSVNRLNPRDIDIADISRSETEKYYLSVISALNTDIHRLNYILEAKDKELEILKQQGKIQQNRYNELLQELANKNSEITSLLSTKLPKIDKK